MSGILWDMSFIREIYGELIYQLRNDFEHMNSGAPVDNFLLRQHLQFVKRAHLREISDMADECLAFVPNQYRERLDVENLRAPFEKLIEALS